jgi:hypothetical protein
MDMRKGLTAMLALALAVPIATAPVLSGEAQAQSWAEREAQRDREWNERRDRRYRGSGDYRSGDYRWRGDQRGWDASRAYRSGRYSERRLSRRDTVYRGRDGRYYCRRNDGTTGLVVGAALGGLLGGAIGGGDLLGIVLGGAGGAALGREVERGNVRCR